MAGAAKCYHARFPPKPTGVISTTSRGVRAPDCMSPWSERPAIASAVCGAGLPA